MDLLAIDIGNTNVVFGLFKRGRLTKEWRVATERLSADQRIRQGISEYQDIGGIVVASVVPWANKIIKQWFPQAKFLNHKNIGIKIKTKKPAEVGIDRLVNALAAYKLYGGPAIIIDFGTATTFDVINNKGEYLGGAIAPGIVLARDALHQKTAKLPQISIAAPRNVVGKSTLEAMQSGLVFGYAALVEGMIERIRKRIRQRPRVIATGGLAELICHHTPVVATIDQQLTLKGLRLIGECLERRIK